MQIISAISIPLSLLATSVESFANIWGTASTLRKSVSGDRISEHHTESKRTVVPLPSRSVYYRGENWFPLER